MNEAAKVDVKPRLGFLGVGWIGLDRMRALLAEDLAEAAFVCDPSQENCERAQQTCSHLQCSVSLEEMLTTDIEGVVIATPSALHARQSIQVLESGKAVFCQKPLGRDLHETRAVVEAAKRNDKLVGVDHSYRHTRVVQELHRLLKEKALGEIYSVECIFHNAYGPDKAWFYDPKQSGGGCMMDLGIHLLDLVIMLFDAPELQIAHTQILSKGRPLQDRNSQVEDHAEVVLEGPDSLNVRIVTSWNAPIGKDADIRVQVLGTAGGATISNVNGSFYDLQLHQHQKNTTTPLVTPPDAWGGRALQHWARQLSRSDCFDPANSEYLLSAQLLDDIYSFRR